ncbi:MULTISPECIES: hypothetical protein [Pseudomonas syringae group]|uniref:hypothetical protein n=1 Tax=Pseudomonas syringae group TaxID=136849 RepID=UPI000EFEC5A8|nr:hypothetical protein [Pseudomonas syringae group genomosp. 3]
MSSYRAVELILDGARNERSHIQEGTTALILSDSHIGNLRRSSLAGSTTYCEMLSRHRMLNKRYFVHYASDIERHSQLTNACHSLIAMGLTETAEYQAVAHERGCISDCLGFLIDADNFYRKLNGLADLISEGLRHVRQMRR